MVPGAQLDRRNRRRRVRHKVHAPAYASFSGDSKGIMLDLHEVLDISENGVAIQCHIPTGINRGSFRCAWISPGIPARFTPPAWSPGPMAPDAPA